MADSYADVQQSFQRCITKQGFLHRFYDIFMQSHPDVPSLFRNTDFNEQIKLLRHGLSSALMFAGGTNVGKSVLKRIGETHGRHRMNVDPTLYPYWIDSLVVAVRETDPRCDEKLQGRWREALTIATDHIRSVH
ncbi:MAG: globin [Gammaproteobacteria bacterium]|nr:globin [Gammaproteobacteria bacterium]